MKQLIGTVSFCFLLAACVSTEIVAVPEHPLAHPIKVVLVEAEIQDLVFRQYAEDQLCEYINDDSPVTCLQSLNYFPPGQKYTATQTSQTFERLHVDAVVYIRSTSGYAAVSTQSGNTTTTLGGITPSAASGVGTSGNFNFRVVQTADEQTIWYADVDARQRSRLSHSDYMDLIEGSAETAAEKMVHDGLFAKKKK